MIPQLLRSSAQILSIEMMVARFHASDGRDFERSSKMWAAEEEMFHSFRDRKRTRGRRKGTKQGSISTQLDQERGLPWNFQPPRAPHFGGSPREPHQINKTGTLSSTGHREETEQIPVPRRAQDTVRRGQTLKI